jgi:homocysteine S-methyltransferase
MASLNERLENGEILLLDGGVSTEIRRRGVTLDKNVWSGLATKTNPDAVRQVHADYIEAGAQIITANTYSTARHVLESINLGHESKMINLKSVQLAQQARDEVSTEPVLIAGSMSSMPPLTSHREVAIDGQVESSYQELAESLADAGADLIIAEMMRDVENAGIVIRAAVSTGLPVLIGFSAMMADNGIDVRSLRWKNNDDTTSAHDFGEMVDSLKPLGGQAAGIMHTRAEDIGPALEVLREHWSGPLMAYAETGKLVLPDWRYEEISSPQEYAAQSLGD